jgi:NAD(P)-dependent dehydrogenase (short-subunit alcohol dehydrogenase family)
MTRIAVTGGSGKAGRAVVQDLLEHGHEVLNIDRVPSSNSYAPDSPIPYLPADLTDFGQTLEALSGGETLPGFWHDPHLRKWNLWGYVDESHVAQSVRLALDGDAPGAESFITWRELF